MKKLFFALGLSLGAQVIVACEEPPPPPPPPRPRAAAPPPTETADAGTGSAEVAYFYNPVAKRDPFRNDADVIKKDGRPGGDPAPTGCDEPLCQFDLESLALVAVVSGDANPLAMLEDPTRVGHIVRRNTKLGKQGGKVTQILRDCIVVTEYFKTPDEKLTPNRVNICVKQDAAFDKVQDLFKNKAVE